MIAAAVLVLLGVVLLASRSCGSHRAVAARAVGAPSISEPPTSRAAARVQDDNNREPVHAQAAPEPSSAVPAEPAASDAAPGVSEAAPEEVKIQVVVKPVGTQFYYKGKVIGRTPFILKQPRNEKRTYEVIKAGYGARRLVVTGNEKIIGFELPQDVPHPDSL
jgi:hypothetical protein